MITKKSFLREAFSKSLPAALGWQPHLFPGFQPGNSPGELLLSVIPAFFPSAEKKANPELRLPRLCGQDKAGKGERKRQEKKHFLAFCWNAVEWGLCCSRCHPKAGLRAGVFFTWGGFRVHPVEKHQQGVEGEGQASKDHPTDQKTVAAPIMDDLQWERKLKKKGPDITQIPCG